MHTKTNIFILSIICFIYTETSMAQNVGIGTLSPDASALLDLKSSNKGFLLPQVSLTSFVDGATIPLPAIGLMVFHTNKTNLNGQGVYYNNGNGVSPDWVKLQSAKEVWSLNGNSVQPNTKLGTLNDQPINFVANNQHQGRIGANGNILFGLNSGLNLPLPADFISYNNIAIGNEALLTASTGTFNIAIGHGAMKDATGGSVGIAIGVNAMLKMQSGSLDNIAIGLSAMRSITVANRNLAIGRQALLENTTGSDNIAAGTDAAMNNKANSRLTALGNFALYNADSRISGRATYNTAIGYRALSGSTTPANNTGRWNTAVGDSALGSNSSGDGNVASGAFALAANGAGNRNIAMGFGASRFNIIGNGNIALGAAALRLNNNDFNIAVGDSALYNTGQFAGSGGEKNIGIGKNALYSNVNADNNIAIGTASLYHQRNGKNLAVGHGALYKSQFGNENIALGNGALYNLESTYGNIAIGDSALFKMATNLNSVIEGNQNIGIGSRALYQNITGSANIAIGPYALELNAKDNNTVIGNNALSYNTTGSFNIALGQAAGLNNLTGSGNIFIGNNAGLNETGSNKLYISNSDASSSNALIYGEFNTALLRINGRLNLKGSGLSNGIDFGYDVAKGANNGRIGYALLTTNTLDIVGGGTSTANRSIKLWADGGTSITGNTDIDGFSRLGKQAEAAPRIKMKKLTVTGPAVNALSGFSTGVADAKVLSVSILMNYAGTWKMPPNYTDIPGYEYNYQVQNGNVVIINKTGNSANIGSKPITILITYEE